MSEPHIESSRAPLMAHLLELRTRLLRVVLVWACASLLGYLVVEPVYGFLVQPLADAYPPGAERNLIYTSLTETFFTYIKLSCVIGLFVAFPYIASQLYLFLAPGLYKNEKRVLLPYLISAPLLFFMGAAMAYYVIMPNAWAFFVGFQSGGSETSMPILLQAKVSEYLSLSLQVIIGFGLSFQLPILLTLLVRVGLMRTETLRRKRRYAVVILLTAAAFLTPPDIVSQILLFIPLCLLYEISIILCSRIERSKEERNNAHARPETHTRESPSL